MRKMFLEKYGMSIVENKLYNVVIQLISIVSYLI